MVYAGHLCQVLKAGMPRLERVTFLTTKGNAEFASRLDGVTNVVALDDANPWYLLCSACSALFKCRSDVYIDLEVYSNFSALFCTATLSWWRVGFFRQSANVRTGLYTHSVFFNLRRHIVENYLQAARALHIQPSAIPLASPRILDADQLEAGATLNHLLGRIFVGVNANASDLLLERRWPCESFSECIRILAAGFPALHVLIFGSKSEAGQSLQLLSCLGDDMKARTTDLTGRFRIGGFLAALTRCDLLITNDSGPMHLAFSLGVPTVSLWGPGDPAHYGPLDHSFHKVCREPVFCSPCIYQTDPPPCRGQNICMQSLSVAEVVRAASHLLSNPTTGSKATVVRPSSEDIYPDGRFAAVATDHINSMPLDEN